jgi:hypothetical protein
MFLVCSDQCEMTQRESWVARISKVEHAKILHLVDVDGIKVAEVAKAYGCTPANIYGLLAKLRQGKALTDKAIPSAGDQNDQSGIKDGPAARGAAPSVPSAPLQITDLLSAIGPVTDIDTHTLVSPSIHPSAMTAATAPSSSEQGVSASGGLDAALEPTSTPASTRAAAGTKYMQGSTPVWEAPSKTSSRGRGVGGALAKPGFGLMMRTEDGDENMTPFRSLDDLLSAVKPILRTAACSTDPVWFSIQSVDLSALDGDPS